MNKYSSKKLDELHAKALRQFDAIQTAQRDERLQCLKDRRFGVIAGAMWEGPLEQQFMNKPRMEVNKVALFVDRQISEYKANRFSARFVSKDGDEAGELAETCAALMRGDEKRSRAREAYDTGVVEAAYGGYGGWRVRAAYADSGEIRYLDTADRPQTIEIVAIPDADTSLWFDLNAKDMLKADAEYGYVITSFTREAFEATYPGVEPTNWDKLVHQSEFDWLTPEVVNVAEYYEVEWVPEINNVFIGKDGSVEEYSGGDLTPAIQESLEQRGYYLAREEKFERRKVHKYVLSGCGILSDDGYIAGSMIPLIPLYNKRYLIDGMERCAGYVRRVMDSQRLLNMQTTKLAEIAAYGSVEKPIFAPEQVNKFAHRWREDNVNNYPYMLAEPLMDGAGQVISLGPLGYTKAPDVPPALAALLQTTNADMQDILGNPAAAETLPGNVSAQAIELVQNKHGMSLDGFMDNIAKSIERTGEIWLSMAKEIYFEEGRKLRGISDQGAVQQITLNKMEIGDSGVPQLENDLNEADFDVWVEVGPSTQSRRDATIRSLISFMQVVQDPQILQVLGNAVMANMEGEGLTQVREYFHKKMVASGVYRPQTPEEGELVAQSQSQQGSGPDAQAVLVMSMAEQAQADATKKKADTMLSLAKAKESEAKTVELLSGVDESTIRQLERLLSVINGGNKDGQGNG